jgi:hypothetical protein
VENRRCCCTPREIQTSKKKIIAEIASAVPPLRGGLLSAADFDQSEWEMMYSHFVEEGLVDPPGRENKKNVWCVVCMM